jgi:hypothetical protein
MRPNPVLLYNLFVLASNIEQTIMVFAEIDMDTIDGGGDTGGMDIASSIKNTP